MSKSNALARAKKRHAYACIQANRLAEALTLYRTLCENDPADAESWYMAGTIYSREGRLPEAEAALRKTIALQPGLARAHLALAHMLEAARRIPEAEVHYREAAALKPESAEVHDALGRICQSRDRPEAAAAHYRRALAAEPERAATLLRLARAQQGIGELDAAAGHLERVLRAQPDHAEAWVDLANLRLRQRRYHDALRCVREAQRHRPDGLEAQAMEATILEHLQDRQGALARLESLAARDDLRDDLRAKVHFQLGALYDRQGEYASAFQHIAAGNRLKRSRFDRGAWERRVNDLMAIFNRDALMRGPRSGNCSERPIFIVGMPYSGAGSVEALLSAAPGAAPAGELPDVGRLAIELQGMLAATSPANNITQLSREQCDVLAQRYLEALEARFPKAVRWIDAMPRNFLHLGLIALLFPMARVIHCLRDPLDTCLSCHFQDVTGDLPYAADLADLGFYYRQYRRLMVHWRKSLDLALFELDYEDLVQEPQRYGKALLEFCGLKWDKRPLAILDEDRRAAGADAHRPGEPAERWRHYDRFLQPLKDALGDLAPRR